MNDGSAREKRYGLQYRTVRENRLKHQKHNENQLVRGRISARKAHLNAAGSIQNLEATTRLLLIAGLEST